MTDCFLMGVTVGSLIGAVIGMLICAFIVEVYEGHRE